MLKTNNFEDRKYSCVLNHYWWWQRHDEDGNDDELQMNGLRNFEDDFDGEYGDLQLIFFWKNYDKNDDKYTMTLKANGFGKGGLRRVATLHLPTPLVIFISHHI